MLIKVIIGAFVLLFLGFFPASYTLVYSYIKYEEFNYEVLVNTVCVFLITILLLSIISFIFVVSYGFVTQNS